MERSTFFYLLLGAGVVAVPALTHRLLAGRVTEGLRTVLGILAAVLTALLLVLIARPLGL